MRRVLKNGHEVYHYWATEVQDEGRSGNTSFEGRKAYSYARNIATIHGAKPNGSKIVLFGTRGRDSATTFKHINMARRAVSHWPCISVPNCNPLSHDHVENLEAIARNIVDTEGKAARARTGWHKGMWYERAHGLARDYDTYATFFDRPERYSPESLAELAETVRKQAAAARKAERERQKKRDEELKDQLALWRAGGNESLWDLSFVALRLGKSRGSYHTGGLLPDHGTRNLEVVETSLGAEIPVKDAKRLWPMILKAKAEGKEWSPVVALGVYRLNKINKDGSIVVGCHEIGFNEIEGIAHQLGLTDAVETEVK